MSQAFETSKMILLYACGVVLGLTLWSSLSAIPTAIPGAYTQVFPVVQFGYFDHKTGLWEAPVQKIFRDKDKVCWDLYTEKLRAAVVRGYQFYALGGTALSAPIPTAAYLAHEDSTPDKDKVLESHLVGEQWHRRWCFDLADRFPDFYPITISGQAEHARFPNLWKTITQTPTFTIAP